MDKGFEQMYYVKFLYFDAGRTITDYIHLYYINLADRKGLEKLCHDILTSKKSTYCFKDDTGRCFTLMCRIAVGNQKGLSNVFLYEDDFSTTGKIMALYLQAEDRFIYSADCGQPLNKYYYHNGCMKMPADCYSDMAKTYFEKSEYIAKNRCL